MHIPDRLTSAAEAGVAIANYLEWGRSDPTHEAVGIPWLPKHYERLARTEYGVNQLLDQLSVDPGPGPAVQAHLPGDEPRFLGKPAMSRHSIRITEPVGSDYGLQIRDPLPELAELVANIRMVKMLAERVARCAAADRARGSRQREADRLEFEAAELTAYASDLEMHVPALGDRFLHQWRDEAARRPAEPTQPTTRPALRAVNLRQNGS